MFGVKGKEGVVEWATSKEQAESWAAYGGTLVSIGNYKDVEVVSR